MVALNWHRFTVAANVTFIASFPFFYFTLVSLVICRGWERKSEWERVRGALWFGCPSHQVLRPCGWQFSVFLLWHILLSSTRAFFAVQLCRGEWDACRLIFTVCILLLSTLSAGACTLREPAADFCVVRLVLSVYLLRVCILYCQCTSMFIGVPTSIIDPDASHFTLIQKF